MRKNWAKLDSEAYEGMSEYLKHAKEKFPSDGQDVDDESLEELLEIYVHLVMCVHLLLLDSNEKYRDTSEHDMWCKKLGIKNEGDLT